MKLINECLVGHSNRNKIINCLSFGTLALAFALIFIIFYWLLYPYNPLVINSRPLPVLEKDLKKGDLVRYSFDYCKHTTSIAHVNKKFSDGIEFALPEYHISNPAGCREQIVTTEIPETLPEGDYIIVATYTYRVNPIREVTVSTHTEKFSVRD